MASGDRISGNPLAIAGVATVLGALSAVAVPLLGYDAWAWMVWAREIARFDLEIAGGPVIKPLPMLVAAPLAPFGDAAPLAWLTLVRASFLMCGWVAWRIGLRLGGALAGAASAALVVLVPGLFKTALQGYSEPVFVLVVLVAVLALMSGRVTLALVALALGGLLRSEEWPFLAALAVWAALAGRTRKATAALLAITPPLAWAALDWLGAGSPTRSLDHAAAGRGLGVGEQLDRLIEDVGTANVIGGLAAAAIAARSRNRPVLLMLAAGTAWIAAIIAKGFADYPIGARYLIPGVALIAVAAGWAFASLLARPFRSARPAAALGAVLLLAVAAGPLRDARDLVESADRQVEAGDALTGAIAVAGGRERVAAMAGPTVMANTPLMPELAWRLDVPLRRVTTVWKDHPNDQIEAPAIAFEAPAAVVGETAPLPPVFTTREIGSSGQWRALLVLPAGEDPRR